MLKPQGQRFSSGLLDASRRAAIFDLPFSRFHLPFSIGPGTHRLTAPKQMHVFTVMPLVFVRRAAVCGVALAAALLAPLAPAGAALQVTEQASPLIILKSVRVGAGGETVVVEIEADGPLPAPVTARLDAPARFFLDFPGVITGTRGSREGVAPIARVRVALHSSNPPVTRVVLDMAAQHEITIDDSARADGRVRLVVGSPLGAGGAPGGTREAPPGPLPLPATNPKPLDPSLAPGLMPVPPLPTAGTGAAAKPAQAADPAAEDPKPAAAPEPRAVERPPIRTSEPPRRAAPPVEAPPPTVYRAGSGEPAKPSERDLGRYREDVEAPLTRLRRLRPLLADIDRQDPKPPEELQAARTELSAVIRVLSGMHPPDALQRTHDMLMRAASLSMMAATLRADAGARADPTTIRNAGSAAAGAVLLLDRVCIEIGCKALDRD